MAGRPLVPIFECLSLTLVILLLSNLTVSGQETHPGAIEGRVQDEDGAPMPGANLYLEDTTLGAAADDSGLFSIEGVPPGTYNLVASSVGYGRSERSITVVDGETSHVVLVLVSNEFMPQIEVIGRKPDRLVRIPGSATAIHHAEIQRTAPLSGNEVFRRVSGVHAVDEEGAGLRANVGIRGLDPDRSRTVLVMEDGVPVALAPYGEPEMYYTPSMDRMVGVEIVKGSGSILFGPQTFGGVINYITADPPPVPTTSVHLRGGEYGFLVGQLGYGTTIGRTGIQVTYLRRQADRIGVTDFWLNDLTAKARIALSDRSFLGLKAGAYDESSNSTYVGLSQPMYDAGLYDETHLSPNDRLDIRRFSLSATHDHFFDASVRLRTTTFGYTTLRNWMRFDFDNAPQEGVEYGRVVGDATEPGGAIFLRNTTGNRNRSFEVMGLEPRLSANYLIGSIENELDAGARFLVERAYEQRVNGTIANPLKGDLIEDEIRTGYAFSAYLQNRIQLSARLAATPGLRLERFTYQREIFRTRSEDVHVFSQDNLVDLIPGMGLNYRVGSGSAFFAGVHRGFGPPRVKDAISSTGQSQLLDAERSWNYEVGARLNPLETLSLEVTGYYMNFSNQVIPVSESSGGPGRVPQGVGLINGGSTDHVGIEAMIAVETGHLISPDYRLLISGSVTASEATFSEDRLIARGDEVVNVRGNKLPYAPSLLVSNAIDFEAPSGIGLRIMSTYIGKQFGDVLNLPEGSLNGRDGQIDPYLVVDLTGSYALPQVQGLSLNVSVKNLFDERYIVSRRPQGIRVGLPRFFSAGLDLSF